MRIAIIGYGKMGKAIEKTALNRGYSVVSVIDCENSAQEIKKLSGKIDVAIEFTNPNSAQENIYECLNNKISVVSGTTGWIIDAEEVSRLCNKNSVAMFYASNFSIGMNIFMVINEKLALLLNKFEDYSVKIEETHHVHKLDKPSGTAITLAKGIIENNGKYNEWGLDYASDIHNLIIHSFREGETIGDHKIIWENNIDKIVIEHSAKNRDGFVLGALLAAEYIKGKEGFFTMRNIFNL